MANIGVACKGGGISSPLRYGDVITYKCDFIDMNFYIGDKEVPDVLNFEIVDIKTKNRDGYTVDVVYADISDKYGKYLHKRRELGGYIKPVVTDLSEIFYVYPDIEWISDWIDYMKSMGFSVEGENGYWTLTRSYKDYYYSENITIVYREFVLFKYVFTFRWEYGYVEHGSFTLVRVGAYNKNWVLAVSTSVIITGTLAIVMYVSIRRRLGVST